MNERHPSRRTTPPSRRLAASEAVPLPSQMDAQTLVEREAAVLAEERACHLLRQAADRREVAADRREQVADRREAATRLREKALLPREGAAQSVALTMAKIRRVNERLVLSHVEAQARTEAAEQVTAVMSQAAQHDCLTGLANRALLADRLRGAIALAQPSGHRLALIFLDLDHFKQINDTLGHPAGDLLLQSTARRLQACVRQTDTVCRQGGDEFVMLLSEVREVEDALRTVRKVINAMTKPHLINGHRILVTVSLGLSLFPDDGTDAESLVQAADLAMYQVKRNGGNNFQLSIPP